MPDRPNLDEFRARVRALFADVGKADRQFAHDQMHDDGVESRRLQRQVFDAGLAGICWPEEVGGLGLPRTYQQAFDEQSVSARSPIALNLTLGIIGPTILQFGTPVQRQTHIPAILRGEAIWVQLLSEPSAGSDLAAVRTRAVRTDGGYLLTGEKTWTSGGFRADMALCLARTDTSKPKHRGLTMFLVPMNSRGLTITRIRKADNDERFCQEFLDDVFVPDDAVLGEVNGGWEVALGMLAHERSALGGTSPYLSAPGYGEANDAESSAFALAALVEELDLGWGERVSQIVGQDHSESLVARMLRDRVRVALATDELPTAAGSLVRLSAANRGIRNARFKLQLAEIRGVVTPPEGLGEQAGIDYMMRQAGALGGGSSEMQRNLISERLLGLPREAAADVGIPFEQIRLR